MAGTADENHFNAGTLSEGSEPSTRANSVKPRGVWKFFFHCGRQIILPGMGFSLSDEESPGCFFLRLYRFAFGLFFDGWPEEHNWDHSFYTREEQVVFAEGLIAASGIVQYLMSLHIVFKECTFR